jgi:ribulose-phosphate 3-epimerase
VRVAPSIIAADFIDFQAEIIKAVDAGADMLHCDVMDGVFVPNLTFGPMVIEAVNRITDVELDAHLMIVKPERYLKQFIAAGTDWLSFHTEATEKTDECISYIHERKAKAGLALNPPTPFKNIIEYCEKLDYVLIMTVNPGFYGQCFIEEVVSKIEEARKWIDQHKLDCLIEVDGGINKMTAPIVRDAGADIVVAGAGVFKQPDYHEAIERLRCLKG